MVIASGLLRLVIRVEGNQEVAKLIDNSLH